MAIIFNSSLISLNAECANAEEAIKKAGTLLLNNKLCLPHYIDEMINVFNHFGSYIVLDMGIAMPHARPEHGALATGFSIITLKNAVQFGHDDFDPVSLVIAIVTNAADEHINLIKLISVLIENNLFSAIKNKTINEVIEFITPFIAENN